MYGSIDVTLNAVLTMQLLFGGTFSAESHVET
jgi:hypothetical protein